MVWKRYAEDFLIQQGIDNALEQTLISLENDKWALMKKRAVNTLWLAIKPEIKHN